MRVLITGARGLLGSELCRAKPPQAEVLGWGRNLPDRPVGSSVLYEAVDVAQAAAVHAGMKRWRPSVVVHAAAMTDVDASERDPREAWEVNAEGTRNVAEACRSIRAFLMAISTDYVFDGGLDRPYREGDTPNPVNRYGRSKLEAERVALDLCAGRALVIRVSGLFGAARPNFITGAIQRLRAGESVEAVSDQRNSPSYTVDLGMAIWEMIFRSEKDPGARLTGVLHLANAGGATRVEVAEELARALGVSPALVHRTTWAALDRLARRPLRSELDCDRFAKWNGRPLREWRQAIRSFLEEWEKDGTSHS